MMNVRYVDGLGYIPSDWSYKTISEICIPGGIVRGPFGGSLKKEIFVDYGYKVYEQGNAINRSVNYGHYYVSSEKYREMSRFAVNAGDFIVSCSGTIGRIFQIPDVFEKGIINQALLKLTINNRIIDEHYFLHYFSWNRFNRTIIDNTQGGAMKNLVGMQVFRNIGLAFPTKIEEQQQIASAIDDIACLIANTERLLQKKRDIKSALAYSIFVARSTQDDWISVSFEDLFDNFKGSGLSKEKISPIGTNPCILYGELFTKYGEIIETVDSWTDSSEGFISKCGDVLMPASTTTEGKDLAVASVILKDNVQLGGDIIVWRPKIDFESRLIGYIVPLYVKEVIPATQGITIVHLNTKQMKKMKIRIPRDKRKQTEALQVFLDVDKEILALEKQLEKYQLLMQGVTENLLSGHIRLV